MTDKRAVPQLLVLALDPVGHDMTNRDLIALALTPDLLDRMVRWGELAHTLTHDTPDLSDIAFHANEARWYQGHDAVHGWIPLEVAGDPEQIEEEDEEARVPEPVRLVCMEEHMLPAHPSVLENMEACGDGARVQFRKYSHGLMCYLEVEPGSIGTRVFSEPVPNAAFRWGQLYWAEDEEIADAWEKLRETDPVWALDVLERGLVLEGDSGPARAVAPHLPAAAVEPYLRGEDRQLRQRAITLMGTMRGAGQVDVTEKRTAEQERRRGQ